MAVQQRYPVPRPASVLGVARVCGAERPVRLPQGQKATVARGTGRASAGLLEMQRRYGNQYVARVMQRGTAAAAGSPVHDAVHDVAERGIRGPGRRLPHTDQIEQALGGYRLDSVRAYTDPVARAASRGLGADAYTMGERIAFASSDPDLNTVAHEVAHVIQQRAGIRPENDHEGQLERRADGVADAIRYGRSPSALLPGAGGRGPSSTAHAVQARVNVRMDQSFLSSALLGVLPTSRALRTFRELEDFVGRYNLSINGTAAILYPVLHRVLPNLLETAGQRMIDDEEPRLYDNNLLGANRLALDVTQSAYENIGGLAPRRTTGTTPSLPLFGMHTRSEPGSSTSTFEYLSGFLESTPLPTTLGDYGAKKARPKIQELTPKEPVKEGIKEAFTSRAEALTRVPRDPRSAAKDLLPWGDYMVNAGGAKDLEQTVDLLASKMSPEQGRAFKEDFQKMKLDKQIKLAAGAGASIAVGQAIGLVPHPAAKGVKFVWQATGAVAASKKIAEVGDTLKEFSEKHPKAFQVMEERRDQQLAKLNVKREQMLKRVDESIKESLLNG